MSRDYNEYWIRPISTGYLITTRDGHYVQQEEAAFGTWDEVIKYIENTPPIFLEKPSSIGVEARA